MTIAAISIGFILAGMTASYAIKINNHFLDDLNPTSELKKDLQFFEKKFAGIRPFEVMVQTVEPGTSALDFHAVKEIDRVEHYLRKIMRRKFLFGPIHLIKSLNKAVHGGGSDF